MTLDSDQDPPEPPRLRALRRLVTALTVTLILGMATITGLLAWRLWPAGPLPLPEEIALPAGERLTGFARNAEWLVLIVETAEGTQRVHLADPKTGAIGASATLTPR